MQNSPEPATAQTTSTPGKRALKITLGCCAGLVILILFACAAGSGIWLLAQRGADFSITTSGGRENKIPDSLPQGNAKAGEDVFYDDGNCTACHSFSSDSGLIGPSLLGVGTRAAERKAGLSSRQYLYESITNPDAYIVDGYGPGIMPAAIGRHLSDKQLADLIAYLLGK